MSEITAGMRVRIRPECLKQFISGNSYTIENRRVGYTKEEIPDLVFTVSHFNGVYWAVSVNGESRLFADPTELIPITALESAADMDALYS